MRVKVRGVRAAGLEDPGDMREVGQANGRVHIVHVKLEAPLPAGFRQGIVFDTKKMPTHAHLKVFSSQKLGCAKFPDGRFPRIGVED